NKWSPSQPPPLVNAARQKLRRRSSNFCSNYERMFEKCQEKFFKESPNNRTVLETSLEKNFL
ncbi:MAG: hypothetical protein LUF86_01065, partial [Clostridiales bacterium]|nr:hypothetical protein [Clostridiales bacterium]